MSTIKAIDKATIHQITSGQVVIDLQTAVKELLENSIDAGATNIEVRFKQYGLSGLEVVDNGSGIAVEDHEGIGLKHHTSKLSSFSDLDSVTTFGFRGEALSSLCALSGGATVTTATASMMPMAACLVLDASGKVLKQSSVARPQGTTVSLNKLFSSLVVRRKEFERNIKREFGKALNLLTAYALVPCAGGKGIRLTVTNQPDKGQKTTPIKTLGAPSYRSSMTALWGPKAEENIVDMHLNFEVEKERIKRLQDQNLTPFSIQVRGLISKFAVGCGRSGADRQFMYLNGRPCEMPKIQKAFNEIYRTFNANQAPFILADFILPTDTYDVNVSPDKRTILLHNEANIIAALKAELEAHFSSTRSTFTIGGTQAKQKQKQIPLTQRDSSEGIGISSSLPNSEDLSADKDQELEDESSSNRSPPCSPKLGATGTPLKALQPPPQPSSPTAGSSHQQDMVIEPTISSPGVIPKNPVDLQVEKPRTRETVDMTVDSSQTSWGRRLGMLSPTKSATPTAEPSSETETSPRPSKKQKPNSSVGSNVPVNNPERLANGAKPKSSKTVDLHKFFTPAARVTNGKAPNPRTSLRNQIASFTAPGSQPRLSTPTRPPKRSIQTEDEEEDEDKDEEDELASDKDDADSMQVDERGKNKPTKPPFSNIPSIGLPSSTDPSNSGPCSPKLFLDDQDEEEDDLSLDRAKTKSNTMPSSTISNHQPLISEIIRTERAKTDIIVPFDVESVRDRWKQSPPGRVRVKGVNEGSQPVANTAGVPLEASVSNVEDGLNAEKALSRVIDKNDFNEMDVVGQFNLGFIIARRRKASSERDGGKMLDDLFIVDQHAADEKYNFETLQSTTKIQAQKLVRPKTLELPAADEMIVTENLEVLRQNGFEIEVDPDTSISHGRLKLTALPVSKNTIFDVTDLEEILHIMHQRPKGQIIRCSKARAMFAMRACRKSVMVGMALNQSQMTLVVRHMGTMDQPWNCPHGRPTMRHLCDLRDSGCRSKEMINWSIL